MPTVTIEKPVSLQETAEALQDSLGSDYNVTTPGGGEVRVKHSVASTATVHLSREDNSTTFHVHGGGLVISRMVNERGIAKKVAETIKEALEGPSESGSNP
jgi:hypothetical protein